MDIFWTPLIGSALGGAVVTSIFGLIKNHQDKANEHAQWLRNRKIDAYSNHLRAHAILAKGMTGKSDLLAPERIRESYEDLIVGEINLVAPPKVRAAVRELDEAFLEYTEHFIGGTEHEPQTILDLRIKLQESEKTVEKAFRLDLDIKS